ERIDIKLDLLDHKHILKTLQFFEIIGDEQCNLSDGGQGIQSNVTIAAIRAFSSIYHGGYYIVADEPEAYLHPLAQRSLCNIFEEIAGNGTQIIITTHSPHFIPQNHLNGLIRVWMENNRTKCKKIDLDELLSKKKTRIQSSGTAEGLTARLDRMLTVQIKEGLFANSIVLCEGESEALSLEIWGEILGFNFFKVGMAIVPSSGKFSMIDLAEFYQNLNIPVFLIFDSDNDCRDNEKKNNSTHNKFLLNFAGSELVDFPDTQIKENYCVFSPNFDKVLELNDPKYKPKVTDVNCELGLKSESNKGIRARYVAMKYQEEKLEPPKIIINLINSISNFQKTNS
ncbi:MAG: AAA family ATPase, partial [Methanoregula sp.]|nr:AAA family ATPase [Methanoregula sp.]